MKVDELFNVGPQAAAVREAVALAIAQALLQELAT
jgi:hypothetical protein